MTDTDQLIAIAEACPKLFTVARAYSPVMLVMQGLWAVDPLTDLNACHEMEKVLTLEQQADYGHRICNMAEKVGTDETSRGFAVIHATARQRCEAFLRVKGLWKETKP